MLRFNILSREATMQLWDLFDENTLLVIYVFLGVFFMLI